MKTWRTESDRKTLHDLVSYTKRVLAEYANHEVRIYVGCDSQNLRKRPWTCYVTAVAFHIGTSDNGEFYGNGVHIVYRPEKYKKIRDTWSRLWKEIERSMEVAETLRDNGILVQRVDLDLNQDEAYESNRLINAGEGLFKGLGYRVASKPDELIATNAADHLLHHIDWKGVPLSK